MGLSLRLASTFNISCSKSFYSCFLLHKSNLNSVVVFVLHHVTSKWIKVILEANSGDIHLVSFWFSYTDWCFQVFWSLSQCVWTCVYVCYCRFVCAVCFIRHASSTFSSPWEISKWLRLLKLVVGVSAKTGELHMLNPTTVCLLHCTAAIYERMDPFVATIVTYMGHCHIWDGLM